MFEYYKKRLPPPHVKEFFPFTYVLLYRTLRKEKKEEEGRERGKRGT
jgi:hypothetical protein